MLSNGELIVATPRHVSCEVGDETVILYLDDGVYYGLNAVGARVWSFIQVPRRLDDIVGQIVQEFAVERERCEADVAELLESLRARQLVEVRAPDSGP